MDGKIETIEEQVRAVYEAGERCQRVAAVEGIGLVPRQHSRGSKLGLFGIRKRDDPYLRILLIHGARSVVYGAGRKADRRSCWIVDKQRRLGTRKAFVALANKNARIVWSLIAHQENYRFSC